MDRVVVLKPNVELREHRRSIRPWANLRIIPLEGFHKGFGHAVRLGTFDWCRARHLANVAAGGMDLTTAPMVSAWGRLPE